MFGFPTLRGGSADPFGGLVTALLHFNGTNGSTTFTDVVGGTWTRFASPYDGAIISTAQSRFGGASLELTTDILRNDAPGAGLTLNGDFTIEGWVRLGTTAGGLGNVLINLDTAGPDSIVIYAATTAITFQHAQDGQLGTGPITSLVGRWAHWFAGVSGSSRYVGADGTIVSSSRAFTAGTTNIAFIGATADVSMWVDEVRITKGVCRYTGASYTVPTAEFPNP